MEKPSKPTKLTIDKFKGLMSTIDLCLYGYASLHGDHSDAFWQAIMTDVELRNHFRELVKFWEQVDTPPKKGKKQK